MTYAYQQHTGNGATTTYAVSFPYITKAHLKAFVNGVETTSFTWPTSASITFSSPPANGAKVVIKRETPRTALVDFSDASTLTESNLDRNTTQLIYLVQEQLDAVALSIGIALDGTWDAQSRRIKNVATPTAGSDAATKDYSDANIAIAAGHANTAGAFAEDAEDSADASEVSRQASDASASAAAASQSSAGTSANNSATSATLSSDWATKTSATVAGGEYSSKEYAIGVQRRGSANGGSAKDWATYEGGTVDNVGYSAKYWAGVAQGIAGGNVIKVTTNDQTAEFLSPSISVTGDLIKTVLNPGANEVLNFRVRRLRASSFFFSAS